MNKQFDIVFRDTEELSLKDGIDLALCAYDYKNRVLEYAGAFNPLYIVRDQASKLFIFLMSNSVVKGLAI